MSPPYDGFFHYLPVTDRSIEWGWYITGAGRGRVHAGCNYPPQGHPALYQFNWRQGRTLPEFQLILITEGSGEFESKVNGRCQIDGGVTMLLTPGCWHRYRPDPATGWTERWISFNGESSHRFFSLGGREPRPALLRSGDVDFIRKFDEILDQVHATPTSNSVRLSIMTMDLVAYAVDTLGSGDADALGESPVHDDPVVSDALQLIWTRSHYSLSVNEIAHRLSVARRTLDRRFAASRRRSVLDEINLCRIGRAKRLLTETRLSIKSVAYLSGFPSPDRMRVLFVESEGVPPTVFRKNNALPL